MGEETQMTRFHGALDPKAREFRPGNLPISTPVSSPIFTPPLQQVYYSFIPYPPPVNEAQIELFGHGLPYPQFPVNPGYFKPLERVEPPQVQPTSSCPTRSLLLSSVPIHATELVVRRDLEAFGDLRAIQMERIREGIVTVHFYDLRHADLAFREMRNHYNTFFSQFPVKFFRRGLVAGSAVWAQFIIPTGENQGTVIVLNLDSGVSTCTLKQIFERFGSVKEVRETPLKKHQRFVEFFDVRDAAAALEEINGKKIHGKPVVVEFSRPGGHGRKFFDRLYNSGSQRPFYSQSFPKKLHHMCNRSLNYGDKIVEDLQSLNCNGKTGNGSERRDFVGSSRNSKQQGSEPRVSDRVRKNCFLKKCDPQFLINEDESHCRDSRTTVMIKNIPNKYNLKLLMKMLDKHCIHCNEQIADDGKDLTLSSYDFIYLPIDFNTKCNVGYGFVNMTSAQGAWRLYKAFHLQNWEVFNSRKICEVTYARLQGLEALREHFRKSKFPSEMEESELPVVFWPPRDGVKLTEPAAVISDMHEEGASSVGELTASSPARGCSCETESGDCSNEEER